LGDIVVGDIVTLTNHNVTSVQINKTSLCERRKKSTCDIVVDQCHQCHQSQCHTSATRSATCQSRSKLTSIGNQFSMKPINNSVRKLSSI